MSMEDQLSELEKAVSQAIRYISIIRKDKSPPASDEDIEKLSAENNRLIAERKEAKRRIGVIIRKIDKAKWTP